MDDQEGKAVVGKHHAADHQPRHGQEKQPVDDLLKHPKGRVFPRNRLPYQPAFRPWRRRNRTNIPAPAHSWAASAQNWQPIRNSSARVMALSAAIFATAFGLIGMPSLGFAGGRPSAVPLDLLYSPRASMSNTYRLWSSICFSYARRRNFPPNHPPVALGRATGGLFWAMGESGSACGAAEGGVA